jgi:two-component system, chemotaxis family, sensor kinase CheA
MEELQRQFISDAAEIVEKLTRDVADLRVAHSEGRRRRELAARIFRHVHTLKGTALSLEVKALGRIAHEFEAVLDGVRLGRIDVTDEVLELFEEATELLGRALTKPSPQPGTSNTDLLTGRLAGLAAKSKQQGFIADSLRSTLPADIARALTEYDLQHAREAVREGARLFLVSAQFAVRDCDEGFRQLTRVLGETGEIIATVPAASSEVAEIHFRLLYAAEIVTPAIRKRASTLGQIEIEQLELSGPPQTAGPNQPTTTAFQFEAQPASSVQVSLREIEGFVCDLRDLFRETSPLIVSAAAVPSLQRRFSILEEKLIKLRLVPCSALLERTVIRSGRIAARQLGKQVQFEIEGGDVGIDKSLADIILDPLLHLVGNAITHGIERPEERVAAGKNATGKIKLQASNVGSRVHISVSDDGRGIDVAGIAAIAYEQGIVKRPEELGPDQCLRLIFRPGFSTSTEVSALSGRGIGLEVVDRAMEQAGGEVRLATEAGKGTTFVMMLPFALTVLPCLLVKSADQFYGISSACVRGMRSLTALEMTEVAGENYLDWDGARVPAISLRSLTNQTDEIQTSKGSALLYQAKAEANSDHNRYALLVDAIVGRHETLIRGLGRHAARWPGVSGAAELWDGNVALVLDLDELIERHQELSDSHEKRKTAGR